jgi:uncharacterized SAM-binding protein YcdF (DUF218 family)
MMDSIKYQEGKKGLGGRLWALFRAVSVVFTITVLIIMFTPLSNYMARTLIVAPEFKKTDLIAVLGGGAYVNGVLGGASNERLIQGMILYREGYAPEIIFSGGTIIKPSKKVLHTILKSEDTSLIDVVEAAIMKDVSLKLGIPEQDVAVDAASTHTYGNIKGIKDYMAARGLKTCLIVTSPTHMYRSYRVTQKLGLDCYPAPVRDYTWHISSAVGRLGLFRAVLWEYAGLVVYRFYGYI